MRWKKQGASFTRQNGTVAPDEVALAAARFHGKRVAEVTAKFTGEKTQESLG